MPKEKVESKPSNVQKIQKPKISNRAKIDEIKKPSTTRESSIDRTDRNNIKSKPKISSNRVKIDEIKKPRETSIDRNNLKIDTKVKKTESISFRNSKTSLINKTKNETAIASTSSSRKPIKATKSTPTITSNSRPQVPSKGTTKASSSSRDVTSKRVTKEQFFPQKKYPFSSYLHEDKPSEETKRQIENKMKVKAPKLQDKSEDTKRQIEIKAEAPKLSRERTMTRVLSPSEVKVIQNIERPRTATIRKAEIVEVKSETKVKKDEGKSETKAEEDEIKSESSNNYEDDFESYESDFEVYSSSSSVLSETDGEISSSSSSDSEKIPEFNQKRLNSAGTDDEKKLDSGTYDLHDVKHKQILDNIKEAIEKENSNLNQTSLASLSDEGFEDGSKFINGFVNFMDAKKKQQLKKINLKTRKRGDDLMNMIRLNSVYFSLFDMEPISYEVFMQNYGKSGTIQSSAQTGDDDLHEEIQTDPILMVDKSTQYPIRFSKNNDYFGEIIHKEHKQNGTKQLIKFMAKAGTLMLHILNQNETKPQKQIRENYSEIHFSDGYLNINFEKTPFLRGRNVVYMTFGKTGHLLSVHEGGWQVFQNETEQLLSRPAICLWDIFELSYPQHILVSSGNVTRACFDTIHENFIFGAICDGSICLWDLRESPLNHREIDDESSDQNHLMRTASYTTIPHIDSETCNEKIVAVKSFNMENNSQNGIQICTCSESGIIIIWSLIQKHVTSEYLSEDPGMTLWGTVVLVQGLVIQLEKLNPNLTELQCFDLVQDANQIYVASNYGVLHCLVSGMKPKPKLYKTENSITCIEMAPFSPTYFLSGGCNGIKLHSRFYEKPLMILRTEETTIEMIQWSKCRPCVLFVKDDKSINIWDLMASDMFPIYTIPFNENITDIKLSPVLKETEPCYMAIANVDYGIRLHKISKEFSRLTPEQYKTELNTFLNYANRL